MESQFKKSLAESLYVHYPLKLMEDRSLEAFNLAKTVEDSMSLWDGKSLDDFCFEGEGRAFVSEAGTLCLETKARSEQWPACEARADDPAAGRYATFGSYIARLNIKKRRPRDKNRIWFKIRPCCPGLHHPLIRVGIVNNGSQKLPDAYSREGFHAINLKNNEWNTCTWEIDSLPHDALEEVSFQIHRYGREVSGADELRFELTDIRLQRVAPNVVHGWECDKESVAYSASGYFKEGKKTAIANTREELFLVIDADSGAEVYRGRAERINNCRGCFSVLDFSSLRQEGTYYLQFGAARSKSFPIGDAILEDVLWKLVNFLYCERCGYPVPGSHGTCHQDVTARHKGVSLSFSGGWHDAADVSQQTVQTAEILDAVIAAAARVKEREQLLYLRLMEEANWGLDFVLRMRFGDGYRAANSAIRRWTDNLAGNMDDCEADVNNRSFENFIFAAVEAGAGEAFSELDPELADKCLAAAREDFSFARERFQKTGLEPPNMQEHTSGASLSQYYAAAAWAAARLYQSTGEDDYRNQAAEYSSLLLACQETGDALPMKGFFYRDQTKKQIVHSSHQARDQIFVMALAAVCLALPDHGEKAAWEERMRLHGSYLKELSQYTAPYGMLPAGIHHISEAMDEETFCLIHPQVDYKAERENYIAQLKAGTDLGGGYYIRNFPVWFSFRGNAAVMLSMGKAASVLGVYFKDQELIGIAAEQLYWMLGKNPFRQSLVYGEGERYGQQYTALLGETVGEMPVGVETRGNEDLPYWPPGNIATYKEVWTTPPGRFLWIAADLF